MDDSSNSKVARNPELKDLVRICQATLILTKDTVRGHDASDVYALNCLIEAEKNLK